MITTELVSVDDYVPRFRPAIREDRPISSRSAGWFTVRFDFKLEKVFFRLLDVIGIAYKYFTFTQRQSRRYGRLHGGERDVQSAWLPGYVFVYTDIENDYWQQMYAFPGFIGILGNPTSLHNGEIDLIEPRFLNKIPARDPGDKFAVGDTIKLITGFFKDHVSVISEINSVKQSASFTVFIFGRPSLITTDFADIERVI